VLVRAVRCTDPQGREYEVGLTRPSSGIPAAKQWARFAERRIVSVRGYWDTCAASRGKSEFSENRGLLGSTTPENGIVSRHSLHTGYSLVGTRELGIGPGIDPVPASGHGLSVFEEARESFCL
jgi:hypothetical protein